MTNNRNDSPDHLTFSQRYGYAPLPEPMQLEEIGRDLRREIWNATRELLISIRSFGKWSSEYYFDENGQRFIERVLGKLLRKAEDEINIAHSEVFNGFKELVLLGRFNTVLDLVETIAHENQSAERSVIPIFTNRIAASFERYAAAYWLDTSSRPYQFFPRSNRAQGEATREAIKTIREGGMQGADTHLRQAAGHIKAQQYADSITDSIHAVESVARTIDPAAEKMLGPALKSLEKTGLLKHSALNEAFRKLYGYTSDEQGIRYSLLEKNAPDVGLDEAMFMFGACASFAAYLVNKHREAEKGGDQ